MLAEACGPTIAAVPLNIRVLRRFLPEFGQAADSPAIPKNFTRTMTQISRPGKTVIARVLERLAADPTDGEWQRLGQGSVNTPHQTRTRGICVVDDYAYTTARQDGLQNCGNAVWDHQSRPRPPAVLTPKFTEGENRMAVDGNRLQSRKTHT
jgi:hypothetical protein